MRYQQTVNDDKHSHLRLHNPLSLPKPIMYPSPLVGIVKKEKPFPSKAGKGLQLTPICCLKRIDIITITSTNQWVRWIKSLVLMSR